MVVQAINIGYDVAGGQVDLLIPGGGVGLFNACTTQWGIPVSELGAQYGGLLSACQEQVGYQDLAVEDLFFTGWLGYTPGDQQPLGAGERM